MLSIHAKFLKRGWSSKERISVKAELLPGDLMLSRASQLTVLGTMEGDDHWTAPLWSALTFAVHTPQAALASCP